jgi:hypothetical protein
MKTVRRASLALSAVLLSVTILSISGPAQADTSWGGYKPVVANR